MEILKSIIFGGIFPIYATEWVACYENEDGDLYTAVSMDVWDVEFDYIPAGVVQVKSFCWLWRGWFGKPVSEVISFGDYRRTIDASVSQ